MLASETDEHSLVGEDSDIEKTSPFKLCRGTHICQQVFLFFLWECLLQLFLFCSKCSSVVCGVKCTLKENKSLCECLKASESSMWLVGDEQYDSLEFSATFVTYTAMDVTNGEIVDFTQSLSIIFHFNNKQFLQDVKHTKNYCYTGKLVPIHSKALKYKPK
ncbi:hypothetical protein PR048_011816 [Dryococelus australis]|uniref:Uncharacterized protein n=1 Tax=Dryococelus australis TaxID=614101 RepID=A0ABQ9HMP9_9NEOP|nr:hypothetical protein PR048_011816 [Dryococelus australis]